MTTHSFQPVTDKSVNHAQDKLLTTIHIRKMMPTRKRCVVLIGTWAGHTGSARCFVRPLMSDHHRPELMDS